MRRRRRFPPLVTILFLVIIANDATAAAAAAAAAATSSPLDNEALARKYNISQGGSNDSLLNVTGDSPLLTGTDEPLLRLQELLDAPHARAARHIQLTHLNEAFFCHDGNLHNNHTADETASNGTSAAVVRNLVDLFFPRFAMSTSGSSFEYEAAVAASRLLDTSSFRLHTLNMSANGLRDSFLDAERSVTYAADNPLFVVCTHFFAAHLRLLQLSANRLRHLNSAHFRLFAAAPKSLLETLKLDSNELETLQHDTFHDLPRLRLVDLSHNRLKLVHPMQFRHAQVELQLLDLRANQLRTVYEFANVSVRQLLLAGNADLDCASDCGLLWLAAAASHTDLSCSVSACQLDDVTPLLAVNASRLRQTSRFGKLREWGKRWFAWNLLKDKTPVTTPSPYLLANKTHEFHTDLARDQVDRTPPFFASEDDTTTNDTSSSSSTKHVFYSWLFADAVFECEAARDDAVVLWKTQFGYFGALDADMARPVRRAATSVRRRHAFFNNNTSDDSSCMLDDNDNNNDDHDDEDADAAAATDTYTGSKRSSYQIFHKLAELTTLRRSLTVTVGNFWAGSQTVSRIYVDETRRRLVVTNVRQALSGPYACVALAVRAPSVSVYEYELRVRQGIAEHFLYTLIVSVCTMLVASVTGLVVCGVYECTIDKTHPQTPVYYPTPNMQTPPNLDNWPEWMGNIHLPNMGNIQDTLNQVSSKLRRGMEKASVTVRSLGVTSSAYMYSLYEHSSQRFSNMRTYMPTMSIPAMPSLSMPRYRPSQLAVRMRTGMGNVLLQVREFCGSTDLAHTASMATIDSSGAVVAHAGMSTLAATTSGEYRAPLRRPPPLNSLDEITAFDDDHYRHHYEHDDNDYTVTQQQQQPNGSNYSFMPRLFRLHFIKEEPHQQLQPMQTSPPHTLPINRVFKRTTEATGIDYEETVQSLLPLVDHSMSGRQQIAGSALASLPHIAVVSEHMPYGSGRRLLASSSPPLETSPSKIMGKKAVSFIEPVPKQPVYDDLDDDDDYHDDLPPPPPPAPAVSSSSAMLEPIEE